MRIFFLAFIAILLNAPVIFGQNEHVNLLVQSPDGRNVQLAWFVKKWSSDITGFDIKRKAGLQDWVKLNKETIVPGISMKKNLAIAGLNKNEESKLKARLYKLLATRKLKETDTDLPEQLVKDDKALQEMMALMARDHEIAIMNGFGYTDHTVTARTDYQYGLFIAGTNKLLAKVNWNYGEIPDLNVVKEITSRATTKAKGIEVIWNADVNKMKGGNVAGFNIYRQGIRLNSDPIMPTGGADPSEFSWNDRSANSTEPMQYSISAESIFGIEGIIRSYTYNPADHPNEYRSSEVTEINSLGYYFKEGTSINWTFPKEHEKFLKGFYVEKDNLPAGYNRVSKLLEPSTRMFVDKSPSSVSSYIRFRVIAVYNDKTQTKGTERVYNYFPVSEPPTPQNVRAKSLTADKKNGIRISWDARMNGDPVTDNYRVYVSEPANGNRFVAVNENRILKATNYVYSIPEGSSGTYKFYVTSWSLSGSESLGSDTVSVQVISKEMPIPVINFTASDNGRVMIKWQYPDADVLKGFRLYQDYNVLANEVVLGRQSRDFITEKLEAGKTYQFSVIAIAENGQLSESSAPVPVVIPAAQK